MATAGELRSAVDELHIERALAQAAVRRAQAEALRATPEGQAEASARLRELRARCREVEDRYEALQRQRRIAEHNEFVARLNAVRGGAA